MNLDVRDDDEVWIHPPAVHVMVAGFIEALNESCSDQHTVQFTAGEWKDVLLAIRSLGSKWKEYDGPKPEAWTWEKFEEHEAKIQERGRLLLVLYERLTKEMTS